MIDAVGTTVYTYANQFLASQDRPWDSDTVSYTYANRLRSGLSLLQPNASALTLSYGYDAAHRLSSLGSPAGSFAYNYSTGVGAVGSSSSLRSAAASNQFRGLYPNAFLWLAAALPIIK